MAAVAESLNAPSPAPERTVRLRRGLDISIAGAPRQMIERRRRLTSAALIGADYVGLRPKLLVRERERVRLGEPLVADRRDPRIVLVAPGAGSVAAINYGERRRLLSVVVSLDDGDDEVTFPIHSRAALATLPRETVIEHLLRSGSWAALRRRPFGDIPLPDATPSALLVTAIDTNPLAAQPDVVIGAYRDDFALGLAVLGRVVDCPIFLCTAPGADVSPSHSDRVTHVDFAGPHPAGLPGTHIHALSPVRLGREVWYIGYQDVIAFGRPFRTGHLWTERVVALCGPAVRRPRLLRTRLGADLAELVAGELVAGQTRVISGSVLCGRHAIAPVGYLGRYHVQVSALIEAVAGAAARRPFTAALARLLRGNPVALSTERHGEPAAMFPVAFERVMPLDLQPTPLLRALAVGDTERAVDLGCLELEEEDLALCSFVCPSKLDYGALLRRTLTEIQQEL